MIHQLKNAQQRDVAPRLCSPKGECFIGESDKALTPISAAKLQEILQHVETGMIAPRSKTLFSMGETVRVVEGPLCGFTGLVEAVQPEQ